MIPFVLMIIKILASIFQFSDFSFSSVSVVSVPMLFVWLTDDFGESFLSFGSAFAFFIFCGYFLLWVVIPWLMISSRKWLASIGLICAIGLNLFDIISYLLSALTIAEKVVGSLFDALIIVLSLIALHHKTRDNGTV